MSQKQKPIHPSNVIEMKARGDKITMLTATDALLAGFVDEAGIDMILVGDSLANTFQGKTTTMEVSVDEIIYHTKAVSRGVKNSLIVADMPFGSYQVDIIKAKENAARLIKEGGAQAVKIEVFSTTDIKVLSAISRMGIPVVAHIGFTPQNVYQLGGYKVQGRGDDAHRLVGLATACESAGCFAIVLEMVPSETANMITSSVAIPTIGIGAGVSCDGQVLVLHDLLGLFSDFKPKFAKRYATLSTTISEAVSAFKSDVKKQTFPDDSHSFL